MKTIAKYPDLATAELVKSVLEAGNIPAFIPDSNLAGLDWRLGTAIGGVRLQVDDQHEQVARELLEENVTVAEGAALEEPEAGDLCPFCGSSHVGPENYRRLKMLTILIWPVIIYTLPKVLFSRKKVRCGDCGGTWPEAE
jgi:hypothetical protein